MNNLFRILFFIVWFIPWLLSHIIFLLLGFYRKPNWSLDIKNLIQDGDILLIRRKMRSPWGYWGHSGIVVNAKDGKVLHAISFKGVEVASLDRFYCADEIAVFRPKFIDSNFRRLLDVEIQKYLGNKFSYFSFKNTKTPSRFSCTTVIWKIFFNITKVEVPSPMFIVPNDFTNKEYFDLIIWKK